MATNRMVTAKELEASGLSLRDFLNKERGLTRKPPEDMKFGVNKPRNPNAANAPQGITVQGRDPTGGKSVVDQQDAWMAKSRKNAGQSGYDEAGNPMKRGGQVKKMASGGSASSRADGIAQRGKTKGRMC